MKRLHGIDATRVLCILAVIAIHTAPLQMDRLPIGYQFDAATVLNQMARFAVPAFFVLSGYFFGHRLARAAKQGASPWIAVRETGWRALSLFAFWSLIYIIPFSKESMEGLGWSGPLRMIYRNFKHALLNPIRTVLEGTADHLWFLSSMALSVAIAGVFLVFGKKWWLYGVSCVLFSIGLLGSSYQNTFFGFSFEFNFRNGPFFGLICVSTGIFLSTRNQSSSWFPVGLLIFITGMCIHFLELSWLKHHGLSNLAVDYVAGTYIAGLGFAMAGISNAKIISQPWWSDAGTFSAGIYAIHPAVIMILTPTWNASFGDGPEQSLLFVGVVFLFSWFFARFIAQSRRFSRFVT